MCLSAPYLHIPSPIGSWEFGYISNGLPHVSFIVPSLGAPRQEDHSVQLSILRCLKVLVLRGDYLRIAMDADSDFLAYLQEIFFLPK